MGKRRERRLAAMNNAGRRVKLDLFAEPSGDLGGSFVHEEGGENLDAGQAELPKSPSSSASRHFGDLGSQTPENPLTLLGQYSDDELVKESNQRPNYEFADDSTTNCDDQVKKSIVQAREDVDISVDKDLPDEKVKQQDAGMDYASSEAFEKPDEVEIKESDTTTLGNSYKNVDTNSTIVPGSADIQVIGDLSSSWKVLMHEESNRYYYWNIETGETSWQVPDVLAQETENEGHNTIFLHDGQTSSPSVGPDLVGAADGSLIVHSFDGYNGVVEQPQIIQRGEGDKSEVSEEKERVLATEQSEVERNTCAVVSVSNGTPAPGIGQHYQKTSGGTTDNGVPVVSETEIEPSSLVKYGECLLERLKSFEGLKGCDQGQGWMLKYALEVEIRLSDISSLSFYGCSLLPLWVHFERQFRRLEEQINNEVCQLSESAKLGEVEASDVSLLSNQDNLEDTVGCEHKACVSGKTTVRENCNGTSYSVDASVMEKDLHNDVPALNIECASLPEYDSKHHNIVEGRDQEVKGTVLDDESLLKPSPYVGEDVDMDVDMEVDDTSHTTPATNTANEDPLGVESSAPEEEPLHPNMLPEYFTISEDPSVMPASPSEEYVPPPPPDIDNEPIPPPPPDNEPIPPPPPDEPSCPAPPPATSYSEMEQPLSYVDQYNLPYPNSSFEYYGQTLTNVANSNYGSSEGCQVAVNHPPLYYEPVSNTYSNNLPVIVNPLEAASFYSLPDVNVTALPVVPAVGGLEAGSVTYHGVASTQSGPADTSTEVNHSSFQNSNVETSILGLTQVSSVQCPSSSGSVVSASTAAQGSVSVASTAVGSDAVTSMVTKDKPKVTRTKKRSSAVATTLRSNKKVSSLVDKWKAAKEELQEDEEDEPKNAYEALEKKRQREVEEWRARQIASGDAKDNANFQPLGGDWRERVKRRRAQVNREAAHYPKEEVAVTSTKEQPNLTELSRNLPSGWQAYWDESTKLVYYGNAITSETTWTRPNK